MIAQTSKPYPIIITDHARQRHVQRVSNPGRYDHLDHCPKSCGQCSSLIFEIRNILRSFRRQIDITISQSCLWAIQKNEQVTDQAFLSAVKKRFPKDYFDEVEYYYGNKGSVIYVISRKEDGALVLVTILTPSLLDGMVIMTVGNQQEEMQKVFNQWKRQSRMN